MMKHIGTQVVETDRLILRRYQLSDAQDMFLNWVTDAEVTRFWGWSPHRDIEETRSKLRGWIEQYDTPSVYHWVIVHKESNQAIGYIYLSSIDEEQECAAVHYLISRKCWNQGIATEACKAIIGYAFSHIGLQTINTYHHVDNPASGRVMQKSGMHFVKEEYRLFPKGDESLNGRYRYYTVNANEWHHTE
jgi:ribosomal-protein-alanine N-acetyltransferase